MKSFNNSMISNNIIFNNKKTFKITALHGTNELITPDDIPAFLMKSFQFLNQWIKGMKLAITFLQAIKFHGDSFDMETIFKSFVIIQWHLFFPF